MCLNSSPSSFFSLEIPPYVLPSYWPFDFYYANHSNTPSLSVQISTKLDHRFLESGRSCVYVCVHVCMHVSVHVCGFSSASRTSLDKLAEPDWIRFCLSEDNRSCIQCSDCLFWWLLGALTTLGLTTHACHRYRTEGRKYSYFSDPQIDGQNIGRKKKDEGKIFPVNHNSKLFHCYTWTRTLWESENNEPSVRKAASLILWCNMLQC